MENGQIRILPDSEQSIHEVAVMRWKQRLNGLKQNPFLNPTAAECIKTVDTPDKSILGEVILPGLFKALPFITIPRRPGLVQEDNDGFPDPFEQPQFRQLHADPLEVPHRLRGVPRRVERGGRLGRPAGLVDGPRDGGRPTVARPLPLEVVAHDGSKRAARDPAKQARVETTERMLEPCLT